MEYMKRDMIRRVNNKSSNLGTRIALPRRTSFICTPFLTAWVCRSRGVATTLSIPIPLPLLLLLYLYLRTSIPPRPPSEYSTQPRAHPFTSSPVLICMSIPSSISTPSPCPYCTTTTSTSSSCTTLRTLTPAIPPLISQSTEIENSFLRRGVRSIPEGQHISERGAVVRCFGCFGVRGGGCRGIGGVGVRVRGGGVVGGYGAEVDATSHRVSKTFP